MLAITLGFTAKNGKEPQVLYCGQDAAAAGAVANNPPSGIHRTECFKGPAPTFRRYFEGAAQPPAPENPSPEPKAKKPKAEKPEAAPPEAEKELLPSGDGGKEQ